MSFSCEISGLDIATAAALPVVPIREPNVRLAGVMLLFCHSAGIPHYCEDFYNSPAV